MYRKKRLCLQGVQNFGYQVMTRYSSLSVDSLRGSSESTRVPNREGTGEEIFK